MAHRHHLSRGVRSLPIASTARLDCAVIATVREKWTSPAARIQPPLERACRRILNRRRDRTRMVEQANTAGRAASKRLLWRLIAFTPARAAIVAMCRYMSWRVEHQRGPPTAERAGGVGGLWRI